MSHVVKAYAKINLALFITGKLPNGYHTLETIFAPINWYDKLFFEPSDSISLTCSIPELPTDDTNLCLKAAKRLQAISGSERGIKMHLEKNVPFGAGLGGGSSDAAAVLTTLNTLWETNIDKETLHKLATELGADVPYFLDIPGLALGQGIGEKLTDLEVAFPFYIVTVFPKIPISTVWAYKNFKPNFSRDLPDLAIICKMVSQTKDTKLLTVFENDFESVVYKNYPEVKALCDEFNTYGSILTRLSGSGSAVFGVFSDKEIAESCFQVFNAKYPSSLTPSGFLMKPVEV